MQARRSHTRNAPHTLERLGRTVELDLRGHFQAAAVDDCDLLLLAHTDVVLPGSGIDRHVLGLAGFDVLEQLAVGQVEHVEGAVAGVVGEKAVVRLIDFEEIESTGGIGHLDGRIGDEWCRLGLQWTRGKQEQSS
jgi:hypothetical protein